MGSKGGGTGSPKNMVVHSGHSAAAICQPAEVAGKERGLGAEGAQGESQELQGRGCTVGCS